MAMAMTATEALRSLSEGYWEHRLQEEPVLAQAQGDPRYRRGLFRESMADYARRDAEHERMLGELSGIALAELATPHRITHRLLSREIGEAREHYRYQTHLRPLLFPQGPEGMIAYAMQQTSLANAVDAEDFLARLGTIPAFFDEYRARLQAGIDAGYRLPRVLLARVCANVASHCETPTHQHVCYRPLAAASNRHIPEFAGALERGAALIDERIKPAYRDWLASLQGLASRCRDSVAIQDEPDGEAYYAFLVRHHTTTNLSPAEIHAMGLEEVKRISAGMESIAAQVGYSGNLAGLRQFIATDPRFVAKSKEELRERMEVLAKRIDRRIPEFFGHIPRMTYGIESIPESLSAQLPPAYAQPNPPSGVSAGVFWITGLPERCPSPMHVAITLHEAWPGHLMNIALLQELTELPAFRRNGLANYTAYLEGWAMYCEKLGHDFGLYDDPFARYGQLDMEIWRAVRLVVDTGLHAMRWSRADAIRYMTNHVALPPETIEAEIDRYIGWPGQALGYKVGEIKVRELRERATRRLGKAFDLRRFHDRLSDAGPVTLDILDEHIDSWIASVEAQAV